MMVGKYHFLWGGHCSGAMLQFEGVPHDFEETRNWKMNMYICIHKTYEHLHIHKNHFTSSDPHHDVLGNTVDNLPFLALPTLRTFFLPQNTRNMTYEEEPS